MERLASLFGIFALLGIGYAFSTARRAIPWRIVVVGIALQVYLALFIVRPETVPIVLTLAAGICALLSVGALVRKLPPGAVGAAVGLGLLGLFTTIVNLATQASGWWLLLLVPLPFLRGRLRHAAGIAGNLGVLGALWLWSLPHDFVFRGISGVGTGVKWVIGFTGEGTEFVFGHIAGSGFVFAINVGAIIILFGGLMSLLYYVGIIPWLVGLMARVMHRSLGVSGAESLAAASNVFVGQTEAPLVIRPYLASMTRSEVMALMTGGFATIAGSVLGAYIAMFERAGLAVGATHLISASVMSAPAAFVFAKLFVPETETSQTAQGASMPRDAVGSNALDALTSGVTAGLKLAVNVMAMLLVFVALTKMLDTSVSWACDAIFGRPDVNFRTIYACVFAPFAFLMGVPWDECVAVGMHLGTKTIFNEFLAYIHLTGAIAADALSPRAAILSTYALCGFANFMSIGIQIGGLSQLAPRKRSVFSSLAVRAMVGGALACQLTACIVGVLGKF